MFKKILMPLVIMFTASANSACSIPFIDYTQMNRTGYVTKVHDASSLNSENARCFAQINPEKLTSSRYVEIRRMVGRQTRVFTAELPDQMLVEVSDRVALNSGTCANNTVPKVERIVATAN